jgi:hypothetical protein
MATRVLSIVGTAYRGTIEEQDDTVLWLTAMCSGAGLDLAVLLQGDAVNYGVQGQDSAGLRFGDVEQAHPPRLDEDLLDLVAKGVAVHYVAEDLTALGIDDGELVDGLKPVARSELPALFDHFNQVWLW